MVDPADASLVIAGFEFDDRNTGHLARHGLTAEVIWDVWAGPFRLFENQPSPARTGTHLMIGPDSEARYWTVVLLLIDPTDWIWRPLTGWPSTNREKASWHAEL